MPTVPGSTEQLSGLFYDKGAAVHNVKHPEYGAAGNGVTDDTTALQEAIDAVAALGGTVVLPQGIYGISADLDIPPGVNIVGASVGGPRVSIGVSRNLGSVIKWIGGGAPTVACLTSNLLGEHGSVRGLRISNIRVDCNGANVGAKFLGLGQGCDIDIDFERFLVAGLWLDQAPGAIGNEGVRVRTALVGLGGSTGLRAGYAFACDFDILTDLAIGEATPMAIGIEMTERVMTNLFRRIRINDSILPVDAGTAALGGCMNNTFMNVSWGNQDVADADVTVGAFTGTIGMLFRTHADPYPNNFHSIVGLSDGTGKDRVVWDQREDLIVDGDTDYPLIFGTTGPTVVKIIQFDDGTQQTSASVGATPTSPAVIMPPSFFNF